MPIKLNDTSKKPGQRFFKKDVRDMVIEYRKEHTSATDLKYSHFTVKEILELFIDNKILDPKMTLESQLTNVDKKGLKIYLGKHFKPETCEQKPRYLGFSNVILCNTEIIDETKGHFKDMLDDINDKDSNYIALTGQNDGLDFANICPPDCAMPQAAEYDVAL